MKTTTKHAAPWGRSLRVATALVTILLVGVALLMAFGPRQPAWSRGLAILLPVVAVGLGALFVVRGYEVRDGELHVSRLLWTNRVPLAGLQGVDADPTATQGSIRLWGNGGFFSFSGWFANRKLGRYRMFATCFPRTVVLRFADRRPVVVTPEDPSRFVGDLEGFLRR